MSEPHYTSAALAGVVARGFADQLADRDFAKFSEAERDELAASIIGHHPSPWHRGEILKAAASKLIAKRQT